MNKMNLLYLAFQGLMFWTTTAIATGSDCQCISGFDPNKMPKMNITNFVAGSYPNGSSIYSFDLAYWPDAPLASCGATVQGDPGSYVPVWGDQYCWDKADGGWVPVYWYWGLPSANTTLRVTSKYLVTAQFCIECVEYGTHVVSTGDFRTGVDTVEYKGRKHFAIRPKAVHG